MAATYVAGGEVEYGRYGNPTWTALEDALGALGVSGYRLGTAEVDALARLLQLEDTRQGILKEIRIDDERLRIFGE